MYSAPDGYKEVAVSEERIESVYMSMGIDIDNTSADDISSYTGDRLPLSSGGQLVDATYEVNPGLATFEADGIPTALSAGTIVPPIRPDDTVRTGYWSEDISGEDGAISFSLTIALRGPNEELREHTSALTIYTAGPNILSGSVFFIRSGTESEVALDCSEGIAVASGSNTYDTIRIEVTAIDQPFRHLRLAEIEFGDSVTISMSEVTGKVTYIDEIDPLMQGLPMRELDFNLINVDGRYDEDNPSRLYSRLAIGNPIELSYTIFSQTKKYTVPMGRFTLAEKKVKDTSLAMVAYDMRWHLSRMYVSWSISAAEDLGTAIARALDMADLDYTVDAAVSSIYPLADYTFDTGTSLYDDLQDITQAYGVTILPDRDGSLRVGVGFMSDEFGLIPPNIQFSWPQSNQRNRYNFVDVSYGTAHYTRDLRESPTIAKTVLNVNNPLITTQAHAIEVCNRVVGAMYSRAVTVRWQADPALDLYDQVDVYSKWTIDTSPTRYKAVKREVTFDGMLVEELTLIV